MFDILSMDAPQKAHVKVIQTQLDLQKAYTSSFPGEPSHIVLALGLDPNPRVSFDYWSSLHEYLLQTFDLDSLYGCGNYIVDLRKWLGPPSRDLFPGKNVRHLNVRQKLWNDYPHQMELIVNACVEDLNCGFFVAVACKSGIHRAPCVALEVSQCAVAGGLSHQIHLIKLTDIFHIRLDTATIPSIYNNLVGLMSKAMVHWLRQPYQYISRQSSIQQLIFKLARPTLPRKCNQLCQTCCQNVCRRTHNHRHHKCCKCNEIVWNY